MESKTISVRIESSIQIQAEAARVFAVISDHEGTPNWVDKVKKVTLEKPGSPRNGLGAIRVVDFKPLLWTKAKEEVVAYEQDSFFHYKVISALPGMVDHLGIIQVLPAENGQVEVNWNIQFEFKRRHWFRIFLKGFSTQFKQVQEDGLQVLKAQLET